MFLAFDGRAPLSLFSILLFFVQRRSGPSSRKSLQISARYSNECISPREVDIRRQSFNVLDRPRPRQLKYKTRTAGKFHAFLAICLQD
jgi:hypothetical protein